MAPGSEVIGCDGYTQVVSNRLDTRTSTGLAKYSIAAALVTCHGVLRAPCVDQTKPVSD